MAKNKNKKETRASNIPSKGKNNQPEGQVLIYKPNMTVADVAQAMGKTNAQIVMKARLIVRKLIVARWKILILPLAKQKVGLLLKQSILQQVATIMLILGKTFGKIPKHKRV